MVVDGWWVTLLQFQSAKPSVPVALRRHHQLLGHGESFLSEGRFLSRAALPKQDADALLLVDAADRLAEQRRHRHHFYELGQLDRLSLDSVGDE